MPGDREMNVALDRALDRALQAVAPEFPNRVSGWQLTRVGDYAEPLPGPGYVEVQRDGTFEIAFETDQATRAMGLPSFLLTRVPAEVLRALLSSFDARQGATPTPETLQLRRAAEQLNRGLLRVRADDHLGFAEIAATLREMAEAADKLAGP